MYKKLTKVAIFIDYDNFAISYQKRFNCKENEMEIWDSLNVAILDYYQSNFIKNDFEVIEHVGSFLCVGLPESLMFKEDRDRKKKFQFLDKRLGFIVKYGYRTSSFKDRNSGEFRLGREKGVDSEVICQMMMGAFLDHYDAAILLSDDNDYLPVIRRIQDFFGKKVIQAGFKDDKLRCIDRRLADQVMTAENMTNTFAM